MSGSAAESASHRRVAGLGLRLRQGRLNFSHAEGSRAAVTTELGG